MIFEEAVRHHMECWPTLSPHRVQVLGSMFLHFGDGGVWHEGVVRNYFEKDDIPGGGAKRLAELEAERDKALAETREGFAEYPDLMENSLQRSREFWGPQIEAVRRVVDHLDEMATGQHWCVVSRGFYPLSNSGHALLQNIPDDVAPEWLAGAREVCALLLACPLEGLQDGTTKCNKRIVRKIVKDLDARFGKPEVEPDISYVTWKEPAPPKPPKPPKKLKPTTVATVRDMWAKVMADGKKKVENA